MSTSSAPFFKKLNFFDDLLQGWEIDRLFYGLLVCVGRNGVDANFFWWRPHDGTTFDKMLWMMITFYPAQSA